jgi:hypothetical protein
MACCVLLPHISVDGCNPPQKAGRSGRPKMRHRMASSSWMQRTPAGLPPGIPGIGLEIDGAVQQAPQPGRQAGAGKEGDGVTDGMWRLSAQVASGRQRA